MDLKLKMEQELEQFDSKKFVNEDPVGIVHFMRDMSGSTVADIEICAMWTAMIAWGQRGQIIDHAHQLMDLCDWKPLEFVKGGDFYDIDDSETIYRTLKGKAFKEVNTKLRYHYCHYPDIHTMLRQNPSLSNADLMVDLCKVFAPARLGSPERNSACKRINMLLRWMVRKDDVDLGLWQTESVRPQELFAIMDTHVARHANTLGLISYPKESWKAVLELTHAYRTWDANDPLKYDFVMMLSGMKDGSDS